MRNNYLKILYYERFKQDNNLEYYRNNSNFDINNNDECIRKDQSICEIQRSIQMLDFLIEKYIENEV